VFFPPVIGEIESNEAGIVLPKLSIMILIMICTGVGAFCIGSGVRLVGARQKGGRRSIRPPWRIGGGVVEPGVRAYRRMLNSTRDVEERKHDAGTNEPWLSIGISI
jgi:hypothetical protein